MSERGARPAVSVIIPAHNAGDTLAGCLQSVFDQTRADFEVIVVDDGSTDDTPSVLAQYRRRDDIVVIRQRNAGVSAARNAGMDAAKGQYLCFVDADDALEPRYMADLLACAEKTAADVVSGGYTLWQNGVRRGDYPAAKWDVTLGGQRVSLMCVPTTRLYRADFLRENGIRFAPGERFEDAAFSLQVNLLARRVENIPMNNYRYCVRPRSFTGRLRKGLITPGELPRQGLADAVARLVPLCPRDVLAFCVIKILAGVLLSNLRRNPVNTVDAFSSICINILDEHFPDAAGNPYISLFTPPSLPFIQRAAMKAFVLAYRRRALGAFARAFTRL